MDRIVVCGDEEDIVKEFSKYVNDDEVRAVVRSLLTFDYMIDDDEKLEIITEEAVSEKGIGFVIPKTNYYINLRMTTIAFIGLLLDIEFTEGFLSFILSVFGVTADAIRKLSDTAKCVLLLVKAGDVWSEEGKYVLKDSVCCINYMRSCDYRQYARCSLPQDLLIATIRELLEKNIIKQKGNQLVYKF